MVDSRRFSAPKVVFVCRSNRGKSRMAGAIAEHLDREGWRAATAGTHPAPADAAPNGESVAALAEQQIPMPEQAPRGLDREELAKADLVVLLGSPTDDQWTAFADACQPP